MTLDRRAFLGRARGVARAVAAAPLLAAADSGPREAQWWPSPRWLMPGEAARHRRTWMAMGVDPGIWGRELAREARSDLERIARAVARFEPVTVLAPEARLAELRPKLEAPNVDFAVAAMDDVWIRDTGPLFVVGEAGALGAVDLRFDGWGGKQRAAADRRIATLVAGLAGARPVVAALAGEGGSIEVDGEGTAILTESSVLNRNRNPGLTRDACAAALAAALGVTRIIWLPGIAGKDITDGHVDFYARFARPGVVVAHRDPDPESYDHPVTRKHLEILGGAVDARGRRLEVVPLDGPKTIRPAHASDDFAAGYVNFYVVNGAVIAPEFGDAAADAHARKVLGSAFPKREVVMLPIDALAAGGGGIHCVTLHEPAG